MDEQAFRFNHRKGMNDGDRFRTLLTRIVGKRLTFAEVTGKVGKTTGGKLIRYRAALSGRLLDLGFSLGSWLAWVRVYPFAFFVYALFQYAVRDRKDAIHEVRESVRTRLKVSSISIL